MKSQKITIKVKLSSTQQQIHQLKKQSDVWLVVFDFALNYAQDNNVTGKEKISPCNI